MVANDSAGGLLKRVDLHKIKITNFSYNRTTISHFKFTIILANMLLGLTTTILVTYQKFKFEADYLLRVSKIQTTNDKSFSFDVFARRDKRLRVQLDKLKVRLQAVKFTYNTRQ